MIQALFKQGSIYGLTTILSRGALVVSLVILPLLLSPSDYGALSMIMTIAALVTMIVPLEVTQGLSRYHPTARQEERHLYSSAAFYFTLFMLLVFLGVGLLASDWLNLRILGDARYLFPFRLALLFMALNCIFYFSQCQFRWEFRTIDYAVVSLVFSFLTLGLSIGLAMVMQSKLAGVVLGLTIGAAAAVAIGLWRLRNSFTDRFDTPKLREMLRFSLPLVPASLSVFLSLYAGRLILNAMASLEDVGIYTYASQIAGVATLVIIGVQAALTPLIMAHHHEPETPATIGRLFEGFVAFAICMSLFLGLFAPEFITYFGNPAYVSAAPLVIILAPAAIIAQMYIFAPGFAVAKKTTWQMWVSIGSAVIGLAANFLLIERLGIMGAAIATLLSAVVFFGVWFALGQRLYPIPVRWLPLGLVAAGGAAVGAVGMMLPYPGPVAAIVTKAALIAGVGAAALVTGLFPLRRSIDAVAAVARRLRDGPPPPPRAREPD
jgi:O-antigen/teichoic acid export membrane protein